MLEKNRRLVLVALFAALMTIGAYLRIPVGPVPINLQFLFTALACLLLGPYWGMLSQIVYVILGLAGLPIFSSGGGPQYIFNPAFGYLLGYIVGGFVLGKIAQRNTSLSFWRFFGACLAGLFVVYLIGVPYMYFILHQIAHTPLDLWTTILTGCIVFIPGDMIKIILVSLFSKRIIPILEKSHLLRREA